MTEASSLIVTSSNCGLCTLTISHLDFDICLEIIVILLLTVELLPCKAMFAHGSTRRALHVIMTSSEMLERLRICTCMRNYHVMYIL